MKLPTHSFVLAVLGCLLFWLAIPPVDFSGAAWLVAAPWGLLVRMPVLAGRRPYLQIYLAYFLFWLAALYWLTLPHPATAIGWVALSFYLAWYLPAFVAISRYLVHRGHFSPVWVLPTVWVALELVQSYLLTGFMLVLLGQTQYRWITLIQLADVAGTFGISFLVVLVGAAVSYLLPTADSKLNWRPLIAAAAAVAVALGYGYWRTQGEYLQPGPKVALIQGNIDTELKADPAKNDRILQDYLRLTARALREGRELDLIVWPETMFRYTWFTFADDYVTPKETPYTSGALERASQQAVENVVLAAGTPMLLGIDRYHQTADGARRYNSALFFDSDGKLLGDYAKMHLVMFGEYVPFADRVPWLQGLTPLPSSSSAGERATATRVGNFCYSPSICFESTLSRVVRRLVNAASNTPDSCEPQILVNVTNDGWFWGSSELDLHLICGVFRAVECRKPLVIAANTGFSGWIDSDGRIVRRGKRRAEDVIIATPQPDTRRSFYLANGDVFALFCLGFSLLSVGAAALKSRRTNSPPRAST